MKLTLAIPKARPCAACDKRRKAIAAFAKKVSSKLKGKK